MRSFSDFLEIALNPDLDLDVVSSDFGRKLSKLAPKTRPTISIRLGYDTYNVFKRYIANYPNKFVLVSNLLDRRGDSVSWVNITATNEEISNLIELSKYIINNAQDDMESRPKYSSKDAEIGTARATLDRLQNTLSPNLL
jgi:hypothetical protein